MTDHRDPSGPHIAAVLDHRITNLTEAVDEVAEAARTIATRLAAVTECLERLCDLTYDTRLRK